MTALRPERESGADAYGGAGGQGSSYGGWSYEGSDAVGEWYGQEPYAQQQGGGSWDAHAPAGGPGQSPYPPGQSAYEPGQAGHGPRQDLYEPRQDAYEPLLDDETVALRVPEPPPGPRRADRSSSPSPEHEGRAARRKAAKRRHGRRGGSHKAGEGAAVSSEPEAPLSRTEARRRAKARKPSPAVMLSRAIGEVFITTGVLMLLFVTYQLWWTNVRAQAQAGKEASNLQNEWASGKRNPGAFEPGQGFALLHIPRLDVVVPIAEGISSKRVLDRGMVGHYAEGALKTAMPDAKTGNFGLAGHRNTHGEPFRYINRLEPGDPIVVETQDTFYVYKMASMLPVTSPSNVSVLDPIPKGSGFTKPGRYITLTTCTPEFTSKYRLIVWGKMVEERPRSKGKPDALVN
ncbi:class E sortase [Streptomyces thermocarboxydovorans]|uniref:Class E sortase n=1 Tax=Streptomyces thermocarboxydovorans TaxID=59298 RepID=A0ABN1HER6_9ACTN